MSNIGMSSYDDLINIASDLDKSVESYVESVNSLYKIVEDMRSYWSGQASEASLNKVDSYKPQFLDLADILSRYPETIRTAVNLHQNTENDIISGANRF